MKHLRAVILAITLFMLIFGTSAAQDDQTTIIFYQRGYVEGGGDAASVSTDAAIAAFEERFPNIDVEIIGIPWTTEGSAILETALAAGDGVNVFRVTNVDVIRYAREGVLSAIDSYLTEE